MHFFDFKGGIIMQNKRNDNELYKEMYCKLFNEVTKLENELISIIIRMKNLQCELEEFYINKGKTDM